MKINELKIELERCFKNGLPILLKGAPGVGKTDIIKQTAKKCGMDLIISHPVVSDPTDYKGLPGIIDDKAEFLPYGDLRKLIEADSPTIFFLDDIGQAPAAVQAAVMQLLLSRRINGHAVSDKVTFCAATNRREDKSGVTGILEPVKSRFATIIQIDPDHDSWIDWAVDCSDIPAELIGFIHYRPTLLCQPNPTADIVNNPNPRTWHNVGKLLKAGCKNFEVFAGAVGEGAAAEFIGFMKVHESLPSINSILTDPDNAIVPAEISALCALTAALAERATEDKNINAIFRYCKRFPKKDYEVLLIKGCLRKNEKIKNNKHFTTWCLDNKNVFM